MRVLSLGAGVQSSTLALMAAHSEVTPMPDCAIFADTGAEPAGVYRWLDWLEKQLPFPVYRVMQKDGLLKNIVGSIRGGRFAGPPFFVASPARTGVGRLHRQCTQDFKIQPIMRKKRELLGYAKGQRIPREVISETWIGISLDEAHRMKPSYEHWNVNRYPLVDLRMSRDDCLLWMGRNGYPRPQKSSCTFCPYHDDRLWRDIKDNDPDAWAQAVSIDEMIRNGVRGTTQKLYLHRSLKPLREVDFRSAADFGQLDAFGEECEGMCGV